MRLLALDQSSRITGYAVFIDNKLETYGKIDLKDDDIGIRLNSLRDQIALLIMNYGIDEVAFEDIYMDGQKINNVSTFKILAEVFGVCYELFTDLNISNTAVLAGTWKSTLGIKGKTRPEQKKAAQEWVKANYNVAPTQDEVDAICIGAHILKTKRKTFNWQ